MSVNVLGYLTLRFHPYTSLRLYAACFGAMSVSVLGDLLLCYPLTLHLG